MRALSASSAAVASFPAAVSRSSLPPFARRASTESRLFALASRSPADTVTSAAKPIAVRTKSAAGRAWRSTSGGSLTTVASELACATGFLRGSCDIVQRHVRGRGHGRRHRALHDRRVDEAHASVAVVALKNMADGEDRAAEVAEHHHARALIGRANRRANAVPVGPEAAAGQAAGGLDPHLGPGHLGGQRREALRKLRAVRYDYDPDHGGNLHYRS